MSGGDRFYREPEPIGIGSIVIRFSSDGELLDIGQIVGEDSTIAPGRRWVVFSGDRIRRWHSATILRRLKDWEEAAFVRGALAALKAMVDASEELPAMREHTSKVLQAFADGSLQP